MKKMLSALVMSAALALTGCLNEDASFDPEKGKEKAAPSPAIWVASDSDSRLYLVGMVPFTTEQVEWETGPIRLAASQAKTLILEDDTTRKSRLEEDRLTQELGFYQDGTKLTDNLDDRGMKNLNLATKRLGMGDGLLNNLRPWLAAGTLTHGASDTSGLIKASENTLVAKLSGEADVKGHNMIFLNSPEETVRDIADLPADVHLKYLDRTLSDFSGLGDALVKSAEAWQKGDIGALKTRSVNLYTQMPSSAYQTLIRTRNERYIEKLDGFMKGEGNGIAIIGMPHLIDQGNLQVMLRDRGYKVEQYNGTQ